MPTGCNASPIGTCNCGPKASARTARAPRRWRRSGRSISTARSSFYLGGPRDKLFTIVTVDSAGLGPRMDGELAKLAGEPGFGGKDHRRSGGGGSPRHRRDAGANGCPVRTIRLARLDEASLGELLMHFMLETIIAAHLLGVDAFDQPAVEEGKVLAKKILL